MLVVAHVLLEELLGVVLVNLVLEGSLALGLETLEFLEPFGLEIKLVLEFQLDLLLDYLDLVVLGLLVQDVQLVLRAVHVVLGIQDLLHQLGNVLLLVRDLVLVFFLGHGRHLVKDEKYLFSNLFFTYYRSKNTRSE